jgi:hypothetical protein
MRKLLTALLILLSALSFYPAEAATKKKTKTPTLAALKNEVLLFETALRDEFQKSTPDIERLVRFASPSAQKDFRKLFSERAGEPARLVETRDQPFRSQRILSAKKTTQTRATVELCVLSSLRFVAPETILPSDRSNIRLDGARLLQSWNAVSGRWKLTTRDSVEDLDEEWQC